MKTKNKNNKSRLVPFSPSIKNKHNEYLTKLKEYILENAVDTDDISFSILDNSERLSGYPEHYTSFCSFSLYFNKINLLLMTSKFTGKTYVRYNIFGYLNIYTNKLIEDFTNSYHSVNNISFIENNHKIFPVKRLFDECCSEITDVWINQIKNRYEENELEFNEYLLDELKTKIVF